MDAFLFIKLLPITDSLPRHNPPFAFFPREPWRCELGGFSVAPQRLFPLVEKLPCATGRAAPAQPPASASHERAQSPLLQPGDLAALCHHPTVLKCAFRCPWHGAACHLCHHRAGVPLPPGLGGDAVVFAQLCAHGFGPCSPPPRDALSLGRLGGSNYKKS